MLSVSHASKNAYSDGKTSGVLSGRASGANRCYVLAHCGAEGMHQSDYEFGAVQVSREQTLSLSRFLPPHTVPLNQTWV